MARAREDDHHTFGLEDVKQLAQLMDEHGLFEVELRRDGQRIKLRRGGSIVASPAFAGAPTAAAAAAASPPAESAPASDASVTTIRSPMVGTFYAKPSPDAPPFVSVGDHVGPETTVCVIEAMKVFNEIPAEVSGKIIAVLVDNEEPVEFGKPLFKVQTSD